MKKILVVDDAASTRELIGYTLKDAGYDITQANDGVEALEVAQNVIFDLVLTDINMPNMDGISLVRYLRRLPGYQSTPILLSTIESGKSIKVLGKQAGATALIIKPMNREVLFKAVKRMLG